MSGETRPKGAITNAGWNAFGTVCSIGVSFITAPVLIRTLGASDYGILLLIGSVLGLLGVMNLGLGEATLRYVAKYYADQDLVGVNRVFGSTLSFYVVIALGVATAMLGGAPIFARWLGIPASQHAPVASLLRVAGLIFAVGIITGAYTVVPSALQRYDISSKIGICVNAVRTVGYVGLVVSGFKLAVLLFWDLAMGIAVLFVALGVARRLIPKLDLTPSFSFRGLRETVGYSIFAFLTWAIHTAHRESGKMLLGRMMGTAPVAYLGTPDSIAQRLHMVIASGSEALIPRFSADSDSKSSEALFWSSTWSALVLALILFIPFFVLVPDFLRLWITPEFAKESGSVGRWLALYLISQSAFAPVATYFRGSGRPWFVTLVILGALVITVSSGLYLIPLYGVKGAGYAYFGGSMSPFMGVLIGGFCAFGSRSAQALLRVVGVPLIAGVLAGWLGMWIRGFSDQLQWPGFFAYGALIVSLCSLLIVGGDWLLGGLNSPSKQLLERVMTSRRFKAVAKLIPVKLAAEVK